ncbi:acyltransferase family protein [Priestia filamentosa]|uniref:acyltransferase family protein n=1 Tax=Priestia filamentosa TaxID=1402861 RepID=UPI00234ABF53|nr:acyltransferase family protein [Priestia filamentosa]WCM14580.1 acyltransferase family protein [Priestia filamentosa]
MIFFITVLRALAALLITNAHYVGVYPIEIIANGGLLGDVIFFGVSGFCLVNIKQGFFQWYRKRVIRIYPTVWLITTIYILLGFYSLKYWSLAEYYFYPTYYHFVGSIIVLYIAFYVVVKTKVLLNNIPRLMVCLFMIELIIYIFIYDKSTYHIDTVREPMIRFLFFQSMLLGAYFRINKERFMDSNRIMNWVALLLTFIAYFGSKLTFVKFDQLSDYQIINQVILIGLLYFVFKSFAGIDTRLEKLPNKIKGIIAFVSSITLEIYMVQYVIIPKFSTIVFPLNWIVITFVIVLSAYLLHVISQAIIKSIERIINKKSNSRGYTI